MSLPMAYIVEDNRAVSELYEAAVRAADYETQIIRDGQTAIDQINAQVPDLVVLDLRLPKVSGTQVLQYLKSDERFQDVRVIVVSADTTLTSFLREAADLVLVKPIRYDQLKEMAERLKMPADGGS